MTAPDGAMPEELERLADACERAYADWSDAETPADGTAAIGRFHVARAALWAGIQRYAASRAAPVQEDDEDTPLDLSLLGDTLTRMAAASRAAPPVAWDDTTPPILNAPDSGVTMTPHVDVGTVQRPPVAGIDAAKQEARKMLGAVACRPEGYTFSGLADAAVDAAAPALRAGVIEEVVRALAKISAQEREVQGGCNPRSRAELYHSGRWHGVNSAIACVEALLPPPAKEVGRG